MAGGQRQITARVFLKIDETDATIVADDHITCEGFAQVLSALMDALDGGKPLLPAGKAIFVLDAFKQGMFAQVGKHKAVVIRGEQARHAHAMCRKRLQTRRFHRNGCPPTGVGHGFEGAQAKGSGKTADEGITPARNGFPHFAHPNGFVASQGVVGNIARLPGQDGGKRRRIVVVHGD